MAGSSLLVISLFAVAAYLLLVFLPERNLERRLQEVEERYQAQCNSLTESLAGFGTETLWSPWSRCGSSRERCGR